MASIHSGLMDNSSVQSLDEDHIHEQETTYGGSRHGTSQETKGWDVFRVLPSDDDANADSKCLLLTIKIIKVITYFLTFVIVLGAGVISKGSLLLMTSHIRNQSRTFCRNDWDKNHQYESSISLQERIAWVWCLAFAYIVPEFFTFFRSARICVFKSYKVPTLLQFITVGVFETLHALGLSIFVFIVLPNLDAVRGAMITNCVCLVPGVLALLSRHSEEPKRPLKVGIDTIAIVCQVSGLVLWPLLLTVQDTKMADELTWAIPASLALISCGWWENYVDARSPLLPIKKLAGVKKSLNATRYFTYAILSVVKIIVFLAGMLVFVGISGITAGDMFTKFGSSFGTNTFKLVHQTSQQDTRTDQQYLMQFLPENESERSAPNTPIYVFIIQVAAGLIVYIVGKFTCRICIQGFSFAFPVNLTIPVTLSLLIAACGLRSDNPCFFTNIIPKHLYWECPAGDFISSFITQQHNWIWLLWLLSQTWITLHIWTPKCERLASTEKLFVTPMYCGLLVDQSIGMNRRRDEESEVTTDDIELETTGEDYSTYYETISSCTEVNSPTSQPRTVRKGDGITRIFACATMWHETKDEMIAMLKSIFRMDEDQSARRTAQKYLHIVDPDYYEFETHIFFDDAFEVSDDNDDENVVNSFVKLMVEVMEEAASNVHQCQIRLKPPKKYPTPYGGRLVWMLPGKTKLYAHLKDKSKIRHRKRWSQVMYMYYLLGHRLMELPIHIDRKDRVAENTYLLTLDGDIDFQPLAVQLLVDLMKKNRNLGAACGRIHPIGSGPMVWYQKFEYAIGHWLQKATEHMIGCVLCSPGCFSLFRAKGLMDDNVMRRYTTKSDEARHYVQYDQGEDRWLCTLLLQRGYRVEYSAASDAYTHCPEGFGEFYNQRRRWVPSTMANILDLLMDSKKTIKVNDNISLPYIIYQGMLMAGTILGPGTIFLMLVGAFVAAFKIDNWTSFGANIVPILIFMLVCFVAKADHQLLLAQILSAMYALIMMAVIVGISLQMREDGVGAPSFIFLVALSGSFFIAACLHPQEFWCIVPGLIYYLSIPSMYLLLIIYSLINLNVVTWGTREVQTKKTKQILLSQLLTAFYAMLMMAVIVGTLLQIQEDGWSSPGTLFLIAVTSTFLIAALLHPKEMLCAAHGWLYYLLVPSMYLLLVVFSCINLDNVSWGTREVATKKKKEELAEEKKREEEMKKEQASSHFLGFLGVKEEELEGGFTINFPNLCMLQLCTHPKPKDEQIQLLKLDNTMQKILDRLNQIENTMEVVHGIPAGLPRRKSMSRSSSRSHRPNHDLDTLAEEQGEDARSDISETDSMNSQTPEPKRERDDLLNPYWIEDKDLKRGEVEYLPPQEIQFWKDLLEKYLFPIDSDKTQQKRIEVDLKELRNKAVFAFFMFNALFILIVFLLQLNKDNLYVEWPLGVKFNVTYNEETREVRVFKEYLHLEPIGLVFVFFFALIIIIQFVAMLFHRFGTLSHILASTEISCFSRKVEDPNSDTFMKKNAVNIVRGLQKLRGANDEGSEHENSTDNLGRRKTIHNLEKSSKRKQTIGTLDVAFRKRFMSLNADGSNDTPILSGLDVRKRRQTLKLLEERRDTIFPEGSTLTRGGTHMETLGANNDFRNNPHKKRGRRPTTFYPNGSILTGKGADNDGFENDDDDEDMRGGESPKVQFRGTSAGSIHSQDEKF